MQVQAQAEREKVIPELGKTPMTKKPARFTGRVKSKYPFRTDGSTPTLDDLQLEILNAHTAMYPTSNYNLPPAQGGVSGRLRGNLRYLLKTHSPQDIFGAFQRYLGSGDWYYRDLGHPWEKFFVRLSTWINPPSEESLQLARDLQEVLPENVRATFVNGVMFDWCYAMEPLLQSADVKDVKKALLWAVEESYWSSIVMDAKAFRRSYPRILMQSQRNGNVFSIVQHFEGRDYEAELKASMTQEEWEANERALAHIIARGKEIDEEQRLALLEKGGEKAPDAIQRH